MPKKTAVDAEQQACERKHKRDPWKLPRHGHVCLTYYCRGTHACGRSRGTLRWSLIRDLFKLPQRTRWIIPNLLLDGALSSYMKRLLGYALGEVMRMPMRMLPIDVDNVSSTLEQSHMCCVAVVVGHDQVGTY